ncbi:WecB/TagA/CpsF family glycosyltransferase [Chamaesiphon sp.]|uniref:WecB/TagA/CpsF family glycosyltransferase n=1 Tax=Chamaesiphon sp. TaxID=2814140 RepID=UPI00359325FF
MYKDNISTQDVIGTPICNLSFDEQIKAIVTWAKKYQSKIVCVANVHMLIEAQQNSDFANLLRHADLVTPDGIPLVWMLKLMGTKRAERVAGMDIFLATCEQASQAQISIFLLGSTPDILEKIDRRLATEFPQLKIAGRNSPAFGPLDANADTNISRIINSSGAGIVFVALGCPKQELWMAQHQAKIQAVMIGVGAVFPVYAGVLKHAPKSMRAAGFEWLFRLMQEPRRLWKRYAQTIPIFIWLALKQLVTTKSIEKI